ncbi:MAG: hypothetical protein V4598_15205 [Bdellovibrionota bacterium]
MALVYCVVLYVFVIEVKADPKHIKTIWGKVCDFTEIPLKEIASIVYDSLKQSIWSNSFFIYLFYKAVTSNAERDFFRDHFEHHKLSGLIKVIKIGEFDLQSRFSEQNLKMVNVGRKHFHDLVENEEHQLITIVTASGWDFFGNDDGKAGNEYPNGYLLKFLNQRNKRFEIILLDPLCGATSERAQSYLDDKSHNVISELKSYSDNTLTCINNIAKFSKLNPHVKVRVLNCIPAWKILKVDKEIWAQPIIPGFRSDHTTLYGFKNKPNSIYHVFFNKIENLWSQSKEIELKTYLEKEAAIKTLIANLEVEQNQN